MEIYHKQAKDEKATRRVHKIWFEFYSTLWCKLPISFICLDDGAFYCRIWSPKHKYWSKILEIDKTNMILVEFKFLVNLYKSLYKFLYEMGNLPDIQSTK